MYSAVVLVTSVSLKGGRARGTKVSLMCKKTSHDKKNIDEKRMLSENCVAGYERIGAELEDQPWKEVKWRSGYIVGKRMRKCKLIGFIMLVTQQMRGKRDASHDFKLRKGIITVPSWQVWILLNSEKSVGTEVVEEGVGASGPHRTF